MTESSEPTTWGGHRIAGGLALVTAPLLLILGGALHPPHRDSAAAHLQMVRDNLDRWYVAHLTLMAGFALLLPALLALTRPIRSRAPRDHLVGISLAGLGCFAMIGQIALGSLGQWLLSQADDQVSAAQLVTRMEDSPALTVPLDRFALFLPVGLFLCVVGLWKSRSVPQWQAGVLGLASLALFVGLGAEVHSAMGLGFLSLAVAFIPAGIRQMKPGSSRPEPSSGLGSTAS